MLPDPAMAVEFAGLTFASVPVVCAVTMILTQWILGFSMYVCVR